MTDVDAILKTLPTGLLIDGEWGEASGRRRFPSIDPASDQTILDVAQAGTADIHAAVAAARRALENGRGRR